MGQSQVDRDVTVDPSHEGSGAESGSQGVLTWVLTYLGYTWTSQEVKAAHAVLVAELMGVDEWAVTSPVSGPRALVSWLAVLGASVTGRPIADVLVHVQSMTLDELRACLRV